MKSCGLRSQPDIHQAPCGFFLTRRREGREEKPVAHTGANRVVAISRSDGREAGSDESARIAIAITDGDTFGRASSSRGCGFFVRCDCTISIIPGGLSCSNGIVAESMKYSSTPRL